MLKSLFNSIYNFNIPSIRLRLLISSFISLLIISVLLYFIWDKTPSLGWLGNMFKFLFSTTHANIWFYIITNLIILFYPPLITLTTGFFLDGIAKEVEKKHYPKLLANNGEGFLGGIIAGIRLLGWNSLICIILFPIIWILFSTNLISTLFYILASGYILGREYYEIAAHRIMNYQDAKYFRRKNIILFWFYGIFFVLIFMVPILNLVAPIFCTIFMVHEIQRILEKKNDYIDKSFT